MFQIRVSKAVIFGDAGNPYIVPRFDECPARHNPAYYLRFPANTVFLQAPWGNQTFLPSPNVSTFLFSSSLSRFTPGQSTTNAHHPGKLFSPPPLAKCPRYCFRSLHSTKYYVSKKTTVSNPPFGLNNSIFSVPIWRCLQVCPSTAAHLEDGYNQSVNGPTNTNLRSSQSSGNVFDELPLNTAIG
jgi:hypothetical protein